MVEMLICTKDWELADARAQHLVEKEARELEVMYGIGSDKEKDKTKETREVQQHVRPPSGQV